MIELLLPSAASCAEAFADDPAARVFPAEEATLGRSVDKRRREFVTGRRCAHQALEGLGVPAVPVLPGPKREPLWPAGVVGSITHCAGYRAAAVARSHDVASLGVDAEPNEAAPPGVLGEISDGSERRWAADLGGRWPEVSWDRLLFSAKESVYKAWFPLAGRWLGFADARLAAPSVAAGDGPAGGMLSGTFVASLLVPGPSLGGRELTEFHGRWLAARGLLLTAVTVLPAAAAATSW